MTTKSQNWKMLTAATSTGNNVKPQPIFNFGGLFFFFNFLMAEGL
jgi:hypothetical protein